MEKRNRRIEDKHGWIRRFKSDDKRNKSDVQRFQNEIYFFSPSAVPPSSQNLFYKKSLPGYITHSKLSQSRINKGRENWRNDWLWKREQGELRITRLDPQIQERRQAEQE